MQKRPLLIVILVMAVSLSACGGGGETPVAVAPSAAPSATPTAEPVRPLTLCVGEAVTTLHPLAEKTALEADLASLLYPPPVALNGFTLEAGLLRELPSLAVGTVQVNAVTVEAGAMVVDVNGRARALAGGNRVYPAGCQQAECAATFGGGTLAMDQMSVMFSLPQDAVWSDGTPLRAADAVLHFALLAAGEDAPGWVQRTAGYEAVDEFTVRWTGLPGYLPADHARLLLTPLPGHLWGGASVEGLLADDGLAGLPSYGPYVVDSVAADELLLVANPYYTGEVYFGALTVRMVGTDGAANAALLASGACDVLDATASVGATAGEGVTAYGAADGSWTVLNLGIVPQRYDDGYNAVAGDRADYFGDARVRQALSLCIDRAALAAAFGGAPLASYAPWLAGDAPAYDPAAGAALLDAVGWRSGDGGTRSATGVPGVLDGTPLALRYYAADSADGLALAMAVQADLAACGVVVEVSSYPSETLYTTGADAPLFGRQFDLAALTWQFEESLTPSCQLYLGEAVPGGDLARFTYGWGGWNLSGWANADFDAACDTARGSLPGTTAYEQAHAEAAAIFAAELPAIPLFYGEDVMLARADLCGLRFSGSGFAWSAGAWVDCE